MPTPSFPFRRGLSILLLSVLSIPAAFAVERTVQVLVNDLPGARPEVGERIADSIGSSLENAAVSPVGIDDLFAILNEEPDTSTLAVVTEASFLPVEIAPLLDRYIEDGGRVLTLGGTLFASPSVGVASGERTTWVDEAGFRDALRAEPIDNLLFDFESPDLEGWNRGANEPSRPSVFEHMEEEGQGGCVRGRVVGLDGWDHFSRNLAKPGIPGGHTLTRFRAKGGPRTNRLMVEWTERDGSRWIATVPLTTEWQSYVLTPDEFQFWESVPSRQKTRLNLPDAVHFTFGLARTHTKGFWGDHEFWIDDIGTQSSEGIGGVSWEVAFKRRHPLYPAYHVYPCTDVAHIESTDSAGISFEAPSRVEAVHPRPESGGWDKNRDHRWIPLLEAISPNGDERGTVAALRFTKDLEQVWGAFSVKDSEFYLQDPVIEEIAKACDRMLLPVHLWEGGTNRYTYFPDEEIRFGASLVGSAEGLDNPIVRFEILDGLTDRPVYRAETTAEIPSGATAAIEGVVPKEEAGLRFNRDYRVVTSLIEFDADGGERNVDRLEHPLHIWEPDPGLDWIKVGLGYFILDKEPWRPYGVNYMPSSGIARKRHTPFEYWLGKNAYDPKIVERDLARVAGLGMNMVSVFLHYPSLESMNLVDLLRLCERYRLRVNLSLRPGTPLDFPWERVKEMIEKNRLAENRTVFAYDLAWEPHFAGRSGRSAHQGEWNEWIAETYGSVAEASKVWAYAPDLVEGTATALAQVPESRQWYNEGPWNGMLADYSRFLEQFLAEKYKDAKEKVESIDENHAVSFRMQHSGDPTYHGPTWIPYELASFVDAVDIMEPEAYGRIGGPEKIRPGHFTAVYSRAVAPNLPVFWAEMGLSCWDRATGGPTETSLEQVATYYDRFLEMVDDSHADGIAFWWYAGGYRTNERSDYGILNPDGTDRPVSRIIRKWAPVIGNKEERPEPEIILPLDRSWKPGGIAGAYEEIRERYWEAVDTGREVTLWDAVNEATGFARSATPFLKFKSARLLHRDGKHNAFTDIAFWKDRYYLSFRKAGTHMTLDGTACILASTDGYNWIHSATFDSEFDERDPKFLVTPERLIVQWSAPIDDGRKNHASFGSYTEDGVFWATPELRIQNGRIWRARKLGDYYYAAVNRGFYLSDQPYTVDLYRSKEGLRWELVGNIVHGDGVNETSILPESDGGLLALVRRKWPKGRPLLFRAKPPYQDWTPEGEIPIVFQGPGLWDIDGRKVAIGRYFPGGMENPNDSMRTGVFELVGANLEWMCDLPSASDNSYAGVFRKDEKTLWVTYYSAHAYRDVLDRDLIHSSDVYLAEIEIMK